MDRDWSRLPAHLLDSVLNKLELSSDYVQFSVVCKLWYDIAKHGKNLQESMSSQEPPMLLFNTGDDDAWNLYSVLENKVLDNVRFEIPKIYKWFCGSSKGWLIAIDENLRVSLINPFMRMTCSKTSENSIIHLPSLTSPPEDESFWSTEYQHFVVKATITADPITNPDDCIVVVIYKESHELAFIGLNQDRWTYIMDYNPFKTSAKDYKYVEEVVCVDGIFYAVDHWTRVLKFNATSEFNSSDITIISSDEVARPENTHIYLMDSNDGKLLIVHRFYDEPEKQRFTTGFRIFEFDLATSKLIEKDTLCDKAIFLGVSSSICVKATKFSGCRSNYIYFNRDRDYIWDSPESCDFGVYDFENQKFVELPNINNLDMSSTNMYESPPNRPYDICGTMQYPIWVLPTLNML